MQRKTVGLGWNGNMESPLKYFAGLKGPQVKRTRKHLLQEIPLIAIAEQIDCGHRRVEVRACAVLGDFSPLDKPTDWKGLRSLVRIQAERLHKATGKTEQETHYFSSSRPHGSINRSINTGASKTNSLGCWMWPSGKTAAESAPVMPPRTSSCPTASL